MQQCNTTAVARSLLMQVVKAHVSPFFTVANSRGPGGTVQGASVPVRFSSMLMCSTWTA
jgi:hypothetical protein